MAEIEGSVTAINAAMPGWKRDKTAANAAAGAVLTRIASRIVEDLSQLEGRYRARSYTKSQVTPIADGDRKVLEERSTELLDDLAVAKAVNMPTQTLVAVAHPDLVAAGTALTALTKRTAAGTAIEELKANPALAEWAQTGLHLHDDRQTCAFCGNALTPIRLDALRDHFDASSKTLQEDVEKLVKALETAGKAATDEKSGFPRVDQLFPVLATPYKEAFAAFQTQVTAYVASIAELKVLTAAKAGRLFDSYEDIIPKLAAVPSAADVVAVVDRHNKQVDEFDKFRTEAAHRVEMYRIFNDLDSYDKEKKEWKRLGDVIEAAEGELKGYAEEVATLSQPLGDPGPLATQLTANVARLLGRSDLTFASRDGKYVIERNGAPALGLSEGEQTAISLLYFLSSLNNKDSGENLVVVVDDPVSSLDANVLVGASSHLWSELVTKDPTRQLILFTHNFELFRIWSNQLDGPNFKGKPTSSIHELRMVTKNVGGKPVRVPVLSAWPTDEHFRRKTRSEYHYLFWRVATSLMELRDSPDIVKETEAMVLIPNAARKILESFLSFKFPQFLGSFDQSVEAAVKNVGDPVKGRIVRFLHIHSHLETNTDMGIQPGEAIPTLESVFELMEHVDKDHLTGMCEALGIDPAELLKV